ncbi:flagellin N-terminal helical domain-containing protein [Sphingomonas sp.]
MRISTQQFYARSQGQMTSLGAAADRVQNQIATGKRLAAPSDDAVAHQRLAGLKRDAADDAAARTNIELSATMLAASDAALGAIEKQMQRASELALQARNDTLSPSDRAAIATTIDGLIDDIFTLANSRDIRGQSSFGGGGDAAFARDAGGAIAYVGGTAASPIPVGQAGEVQVVEQGGAILGDAFVTLQALSAALQANDATGIGNAVDGLATAAETIAAARGSIGARAIRMDMELTRLDNVSLSREEARSGMEDTDISAAVTELQKTLTVLQATQASFGKLTALSLFDYLR